MLITMYYRLLCMILAFCFSTGTVVAKEDYVQNNFSSLGFKSINLNIVSITLEGPWPRSKDEILTRVKTQLGDPFDREKLRQDLVSISEMGCFHNYELAMIPQVVGDGIAIAIKLLAMPPGLRVQQIDFADRDDSSCSNHFELYDFQRRNVIPIRSRTRVEDLRWIHARKAFESYDLVGQQNWHNLRSELDQFLEGRSEVLRGYDAI
jgi:hypothetical protein